MIQGKSFAFAALACTAAAGALWATEHVRPASLYAIAAKAADAAADRVKGDAELRTVFEDVAETVRPSVVSIAMRRTAQTDRRMGRDDQLTPRFLPFGTNPRQMPEERGIGSGMILSADGYVLTNNHVVENARALDVHLCDGREFSAKVVGTDPRTDLAVLKIDATDLRPLEFGDSSRLKVGQWVAAFGTPFGLDQTMSSGIVSAVGRANMHITDYEDFIQTDAAINPGNSGGPLVDLHGKIVGVNTAIVSTGGGSNGVGLAIPSNQVRSIYERLIKDGKVVRGWLGVAIQDLSPSFADEFAFQDEYDRGERGVLVGDVTRDSPAAEAGLKSGDIVLKLDGTAISDMKQFRNSIAELAPSTKVEFVVWRDGGRKTIDATIGSAPGTQDSTRPAAEEGQGYGLEIANPTSDVRREFGVADDARGAVVTNVIPGSSAEAAGLQAGDVIVGVGRTSVTDSESAGRAIRAHGGKNMVLRIERDGASHWVELRPATKR